MLTLNRSHLQPAKCNKHFICLLYSPNTEHGKNMEGYQANSHFKKLLSLTQFKELKSNKHNEYSHHARNLIDAF